jgi:hypothetical protein
MGIVAASVHQAGRLRFVGDIVGFQNRQGVHVSANADGGAAFADARHHAGFGHAHFDLNAHLAQRFSDQARGSLLLETELGVHVDIAPPGDKLLVHCVGFFQNGHG